MRAVNRVLSVLLALVLVGLGILVPIEVIRSLAGADGYLVLRHTRVAEFLREHTWSSGAIIAASAVTAGVGLLLVLTQLWRRRPALYAVATDSGSVRAGVSRRSLARALAQAATDVDGVSRAAARVTRRRADVEATTPLRDPGDLADRVQRRVEAVLESLSLVRPLPARVQLHQPREPQ